MTAYVQAGPELGAVICNGDRSVLVPCFNQLLLSFLRSSSSKPWQQQQHKVIEFTERGKRIVILVTQPTTLRGGYCYYLCITLKATEEG